MTFPNRGESADTERTRLARMLEEAGHSGCAYDLEAADEFDVATVAYEVAEHIEEACGDADFSADPELAAKIREWAFNLTKVDPAVARKVMMPVTVHREGNRLIVNVNHDDLLDLATTGDRKVFLALNGDPVMEFMRVETPGGNGQIPVEGGN